MCNGLAGMFIEYNNAFVIYNRKFDDMNIQWSELHFSYARELYVVFIGLFAREFM